MSLGLLHSIRICTGSLMVPMKGASSPWSRLRLRLERRLDQFLRALFLFPFKEDNNPSHFHDLPNYQAAFHDRTVFNPVGREALRRKMLMPKLNSKPPTIDHRLVRELKNREDARFREVRPKCAELLQRGSRVMPNGVPMAWHVGSYHHLPLWAVQGHGARFTDADGFEYSDFNIADMSMFCGYAPEPLLRAVSDCMAHGHQFLLPVEDAIIVSEELSRRYGMPKWQYTLSASQANTEVIRCARVATGRDKILLFDGKYHGHFDQTLVELDAAGTLVPEERGLPASVTEQTVIVPFNDPKLLRRLSSGVTLHLF